MVTLTKTPLSVVACVWCARSWSAREWDGTHLDDHGAVCSECLTECLCTNNGRTDAHWNPSYPAECEECGYDSLTCEECGTAIEWDSCEVCTDWTAREWEDHYYN